MSVPHIHIKLIKENGYSKDIEFVLKYGLPAVTNRYNEAILLDVFIVYTGKLCDAS